MRTFALTVSLLALAGLAYADDPDPEPPGGLASLRKLKGKWTSARRIVRGIERPFTSAEYTFKDGKVTYSFDNGRILHTSVVKTDKKQLDVLEMTQENTATTRRFFFKIEKGELYLVPADLKGAKADFTGNTNIVLVFKQEKN